MHCNPLFSRGIFLITLNVINNFLTHNKLTVTKQRISIGRDDNESLEFGYPTDYDDQSSCRCLLIGLFQFIYSQIKVPLMVTKSKIVLLSPPPLPTTCLSTCPHQEVSRLVEA